MSKIEAGRVELDEHDIDVAALIETVTRIIDFRVFGSQLVIKQHIEENLPALRGDPRLIRQILINLMTNAVKYSKKEGDITLTAVKDEFGGIILQVEDHGLGIPADKIEEAMRPFGQIHDPQKASIYQGTGLGLPLTKAMAELHQAKFELNSVEGEGTLVKITFPETRSKC
jgi:signal transduction histidine kinase